MTTFALAAFWGTLGFVVVQTVLVALFVRKLRRGFSQNLNRSIDPAEQDFQPSVAVILCVRGVDPSLEQCLESLSSQDYSNSKIFVIGDSADDPGIQFSREYESQHPGHLNVMVNEEVLDTCGLKCSNLVFALRKLESEFDFFVLVDADTVPPPDWLNQMVAPFVEDSVCVTTGIRWFDPTGIRLGTWVRYIWNTAAIVQMVCYKIPWGGSLAIRKTFLREADVLDAWSQGFCEDTMLQRIVHRFGGETELVSTAIIQNTEETSFSKCIPWISRQLLTARLHHPKWPLVLSHGVMTGLLSFAPLALAVISLLMGNLVAAIWFAVAYLCLQLSNFWLLNWIESPIRKHTGNSAVLFRNPAKFLIAIVMTQISYVLAVTQAVFARRVEWRQIRYLIRGRRVKLEAYHPYEQPVVEESL